MPQLGVNSIPYAKMTFVDNNCRWQGRCLWGVSHPRLTMNSIPKAYGSEDHYDKPFSCIVMSNSENEAVQSKLNSDFKLTYASGAGYKILCAVDGLVGAYVLSQVCY